jgi:glycosyltransferase involved in cell wall biosynthesis
VCTRLGKEARRILKILVTNNFFLPRTSGSTHFTENVADELAARGHDVLVATATPGPSLPGRDFDLVRLPAWQAPLGRFSYGYDIPFCRPAGVQSLRRRLADFRPDVIHLNSQFFDLSLWAGVWGRRHDIPSVMTVHTSFTHNVSAIHAFLRLVDTIGVGPLLRIYDPTLVTIDKFIESYVKSRFPGRRRNWIPIPVRAGIFSGGDGERIRTELGVGQRPMILSIGHVIPLRDRLLLVEALPLIRREIPDVCVVIVGKVYDDRFLLRARSLGVDDCIISVGEVRHDQVRDYVAAAQVECHDTQGYGLGTASLEVMGSGVPIVSVVDEDNFPGTELISGTHLVRCEPDSDSLAKGLIELLSAPELAARVAKGARRLIEETFELPRVVDRYLDLYTKARS